MTDKQAAEIAPPESHRFVYDVIGYCCSACRWKQRFGTPETARLAHAEAHKPTTEIARLLAADGWEDIDAEALRQSAVEGMAWNLLDQTSDLADRGPSADAYREARATAERVLAAPVAAARAELHATLAVVGVFAAENEAWESQVPIGPGNASYINGFENGRRSVGTDLLGLLAALKVDHPPCCGPACEGSACWDCRGTGHPHAPGSAFPEGPDQPRKPPALTEETDRG